MDSARYLVAIGFAGILVLFFFYLFSERRIAKLWLLPVGLLPVVAVYVLNPAFRVYSFHGFVHGAIVYRILQGDLPPTNPFLAGEPLSYPWGYHCLVAIPSWAFRITPFQSAALINLGLLATTLCVTYGLARQLIPREKANVLSTAIAVFGTTLFGYSASDSWLLSRLKLPGQFIELRGIPAVEKFSNFNGTPVGVLAFLVFVSSSIRLIRTGERRHAVTIFLACAAGSFFYAPILPAIAASGLAIAAAALLFRRQYPRVGTSVALLLLAGVASGTLLAPYLLSIRPEVRSLGLASAGQILGGMVAVAILVLPVLLLIALGRRSLEELDKPACRLIVSVCIANVACFLSLRMPLGIQYKFLMLAILLLGIPCGVVLLGLAGRTQGWRRLLVVALLGGFLAPTYRNVSLKLDLVADSALPVERGRLVRPEIGTEADELYGWIRRETPENAVFLDRSLDLPVYAQRSLLIGVDREGGKAGFGFSMDSFLRIVFGHDGRLLDRRYRVVEAIGAADRKLPRDLLQRLLEPGQEVYLVSRSRQSAEQLRRQGFPSVFECSGGRLAVHRMELSDRSP